MNDLRFDHTAEFDYPGALFPESVTRDIAEPTLDAALAAAPAEAEGYFRKDGWYAVTIRTVAVKRFVAADGEEVWMNQGEPTRVFKAVVGQKIHADSIEDIERNRILIANIRGNSKGEPYGVHTRAGNWQIASDYDYVLEPTDVA